MKKENKKFLKKLGIWNLIIIVGVLTVSTFFIVSDCTSDCYGRGEMLGQGLGQLIIIFNLTAGLYWHLKVRK